MSDRRYGSIRWKRLRSGILNRDGHMCRIQGPRCAGRAVSVHHVVPSSERPDLFFEPSNLLSSCGPCNYGGGSRVAADNNRRRIEQLEEVIWQQEQRIAHLLERLQEHEPESPAPPLPRNSPKPAIY